MMAARCFLNFCLVWGSTAQSAGKSHLIGCHSRCHRDCCVCGPGCGPDPVRAKNQFFFSISCCFGQPLLLHPPAVGGPRDHLQPQRACVPQPHLGVPRLCPLLVRRCLPAQAHLCTLNSAVLVLAQPGLLLFLWAFVFPIPDGFGRRSTSTRATLLSVLTFWSCTASRRWGHAVWTCPLDSIDFGGEERELATALLS
jgi:hypothetical protein